MSETVEGYEYTKWGDYGLKDYGDFAECIEFVNQSVYGDGQLEGDWYYGEEHSYEVEEEGLAPVTIKCWVIYSGSFGNYNSPDSTHNTRAELYDTKEEFEKELAEWAARPEYLDEPEEEPVPWDSYPPEDEPEDDTSSSL